MVETTGIAEALSRGLALALEYWWVWLPIVLGVAAYDSWADYQRTKFLAGLKWTMLEVIPPPQVPFSSPKAADNFFAGLHASYGGGMGWKSQFFQGKVPVSYSLEIVSNGGEIHFFIRCLQDQRNVVEALLFAQYPEAEIRVVPDYVALLPADVDLSQYDIAGAELEFTKEQAYPIKTYEEFEEAGGKDEYARLDPIAPLLEVMSALRPGEYLWLQYVIRATGGDWAKEGQKVVDKLAGKPEKKPEPVLQWLFAPIEFIINTLSGAEPEVKKEEKVESNLGKLTPAQKDVLEKVEHKLAKLAFKTGIRLLYTASKDSFNGSRIAGVTGMFKQLYFTNLNSFKPSNATRDKGVLAWLFPSDVGFFAGERTAKKKKGMYGAYLKRAFPGKLVFLTTEELATLWHLPGLNVKAPLMPRVQAKKGQPPAILPTR